MSIFPNPGSESSAPSSLGAVAPEDRTLGMIAYVLAIFTSWLGPLILWLVKKDQSKFVAYHCLQALLLMAAMFVVGVAANILTVLHLGLIAWPVAGLIGLVAFVLNILAALAANKGDWYEMPVVGKFARQIAGV